MSNKFFSWIFGLFFVVAVVLTGIRVFVAQDYPVLIEESFEGLLDDENGGGEMMENEAVVDPVQKNDVLDDSDPVLEDAL